MSAEAMRPPPDYSWIKTECGGCGRVPHQSHFCHFGLHPLLRLRAILTKQPRRCRGCGDIAFPNGYVTQRRRREQVLVSRGGGKQDRP